MKENLKRILVEVPTIVLSVIIALAINQWNTGREREQLASNVLMTIREELSFNTTQVRKAYEYHVPMVKELITGTRRMFSIPMKREQITLDSPEALERKLKELFERFGEIVDKPLHLKMTGKDHFTFQYSGQILKGKAVNDTLKIYGRGNISLHSALVRNNAWRIAQAAQIAPYLDFALIARMSEVDLLHIEYEKTTGRIVEMLYKGDSDVTPAMQDLLYFESALLKKYSEIDSLLNR